MLAPAASKYSMIENRKKFFASFRSSKLSNKANLINEANKPLDHNDNERPNKNEGSEHGL